MPGYIPNPILTPFSPAVTEAAVKACTEVYEAEHIITNLLQLSKYLIDLISYTNIFGFDIHDPYSPSLRTLYERLNAGYVAISPLSGIAKDKKRLRETLEVRLKTPVAERPLEDFEDLYYAIVARMKDMVQMLNIRLASGFNTLSDALYVGGPSIETLCANLAEYWDILNNPSCVRALDDAIRLSRVDRLFEEIYAELEADVITPDDADELLTDLYESKDTTEGFSWIAAWSPAMIGGWLEEKYFILMEVEKSEARSQARKIKSRAKKTGVKKSRSRSPAKGISNLERMLQKMDIGATQGQGDDGNTEVFRPSPSHSVQVVQQPDENKRIVSQHIDQKIGNDVNGQGQHSAKETKEPAQHRQSDHALEWQMKSQRVSEYFDYLRSAASSGARSIVNQTKSRASVRGNTYGGYAPEAFDGGADALNH